MKNRGVRLAYVIIAVYAAAAAFLFVRGLDDSGVLGGDGLVLVDGVLPAVSSSQTIDLVQQVATERGANIGRTVDDLSDPGGVRHLYLAVGDPFATAGSWLATGYPSFGREVRTDVHPISDVADLDPRGYYVVFGDQAATQALVDGLRGQGYEVQSRAYYDPGNIAAWVINQPLGLSTVVAALLVALTVAAGVLANVKGYAVQRLLGARFTTLLGRDLRRTTLFATLVFAAAAVVMAVILGIYNHGAHALLYAAVTAVVAAALVLVAVVGHVVALALVSGLPILESIKGRLPSTAATAIVYMVRIPAIVVAVGAVVTASVAVGQVADHQAARQAWLTAGNAVYVNFNPNLSQDETNNVLAGKAGQWLREAEPSGRMILAQQDRLDLLMGGPPADVLLVNDNYLAHQNVQDGSGRRIQNIPARTVMVLVPPNRAGEADAITHAVTAWATSLTARSGGAAPAVQAVTLASDQRLFTYGNPAVPNENVLLSDAVAVVINSNAGVISDDAYMSYASGGGVILTDQQNAIDTATEAGLRTFIIGFRPAALDAAADYAQLVRDLRVHAFNLLAALGILLATAVAVTQIYTRKNAQTIFAKVISGWTFVRTHPRLLAAEAVIAVAIVAWSARTTTLARQAASAGAPHPARASDIYLLGGWQPAVLTVLAALNLAFLVGSLTVLARRLVRTRSSEA